MKPSTRGRFQRRQRAGQAAFDGSAALALVGPGPAGFALDDEAAEGSARALRSVLTQEKIMSERDYAKAERVAREKVDALIGGGDPRLLRWLNDFYILAVGYHTGLRVSELSNLDWRDIDLESEDMSLVVRCGKGGKARVVHFGQRVAEFLRELRTIQGRFMPWMRPDPSGRLAVFASPKSRCRLGRKGMHNRFKDLARRAGLRTSLSMHSMRHGYATRMLNAGVRLDIVQKMLGHSSLDVTAIYLHFTKEAMASVQKLT